MGDDEKNVNTQQDVFAINSQEERRAPIKGVLPVLGKKIPR